MFRVNLFVPRIRLTQTEKIQKYLETYFNVLKIYVPRKFFRSLIRKFSKYLELDLDLAIVAFPLHRVCVKSY